MTMREVKHNGQLLAVIVDRDYRREGIEFFTPGQFSQQLGYMSHPKGYKITPHIHLPVPRQVHYTQEVLFIKSGCVRADFYSEERVYVESCILRAGDFILLAHGGHGFEMLERSEIIEVKQGPYAGEEDKKRFDGIEAANTIIK